MKNIIYIVVLVTLSIVKSYSQIYIFDRNTVYSDAVLTSHTNKISTGQIQDFNVIDVYIESDITDLLGFERSFFAFENFKYKFRKNANSPLEKISLDTIQSVAIYNKGNTITRWDKLKIKKINSKLELVDTDLELFIPLFYEGKINLYVYGLKVERLFDRTKYDKVIYIKNPNDDFAIPPIDFGNQISLLVNLNRLGDIFLKSFREVGKDCPEFIEYLNTFSPEVLKERLKNSKKENKEKIKAYTDKGHDKRDAELYVLLDTYLQFIKEYENRCQ